MRALYPLASPSILPYNALTRTDTLGGSAGLLFFEIKTISEIQQLSSDKRRGKDLQNT
ncbi:MAG: hypothetical protein QM488_07065 [Rhizobiaceae bacterium]